MEGPSLYPRQFWQALSQFPGGAVVKNLPTSAGDTGGAGSIPGSRGSLGVGNGNPLLYSCLENSMDRGLWWATVHGITQSQTRLSMHTRVCRQKAGWVAYEWGSFVASDRTNPRLFEEEGIYRKNVRRGKAQQAVWNSQTWKRIDSEQL